MNFKLLSKVLGLLVLLMGAAMLVCLIFELVRPEMGDRHRDSIVALGIAASSSFTLGLILAMLGRGSGKQMFRKEAVAIVGTGWLLCSAVGAMPYVFCHPGLSLAGAFFESASGFTTTGASVIADLNQFPRSILLWRALTQWLGGMGILVLFVAVLSYFGVGGKVLFRHESSARTGGGFQTRIQETALRLWQIYIGLSAICLVGLLFMGMDAFDAVTTTFTALSTGGFSIRNESIAFYQSAWVDWWLVLFMAIGGGSFMFFAWFLKRGVRQLRLGEEMALYLIILTGASLTITYDLLRRDQDYGILLALRHAAFQVSTIMTTTGFATADFDKWPALSKIVLVLLMFIGGCAGSTAGGVKVGRVLLFFKIARQEITTAFRPNQVIPLRLNGVMVPAGQRSEAVFLLSLACVMVAFGSIAVSLLEPQTDIVTAFTAVVATLFNIGPGLGDVGPTRNFSGFKEPTLVVLTFLMIIGRLEFMALLALFMPSLWKRF